MGSLHIAPGRITMVQPKLKPGDKLAEPFYQSRAWRDLLKRIIRTRGRVCQQCGAQGHGVRIIGDHIIERKDGGADLDERNVLLRCQPCHNRKSARERMRRQAEPV